MAKVKNMEKHGSVGPSTFQTTVHGVIERVRTWPLDPQTPLQLEYRAMVKAVKSQWRHLPEAARLGWRALGRQMQGSPSGPNAHFKVNITLAKCGLPLLTEAPPMPVLGQLTCAALLVDDTPQVKVLQVSDPAGADWWVVEACAPVHGGITYVANRFRQLTVVPGVAGAAADLDLTALYVKRFAAPEAGERVCVRLRPMKNGFKGEPVECAAMVATRLT